MQMGFACPTVDRSYVLPFNLRAMCRLTLGTALLVSTVMSIPDTIAILPSTHDPTALAVRVLGMWLTVFIQWSLAFLGILHAMALVNRGILVCPDGIKLSRFSKLLPWSDIAGIGGDSRPLISKLTFRNEPAVRLNIYVKEKGKIKTHNLDSLLFAQAEFESLVQVICTSSFGYAPSSALVVITERQPEKVVASYKRSGTKSKLVTVYIAFMLVLFTARSAARNYFYNQAGQSFNQADYLESKRLCELSLTIDGSYPFALDRLARSEFRLHDAPNAEQHWNKALRMKPDMVSAKVGLSNICIQRRQFESAKSLLKSALRLEPRDIPVYLNLGYVSLQLGEKTAALNYFNKALLLAPDNPTVRLLSAQAYLETGSVSKAANLLSGLVSRDIEPHNRGTFTQVKRELLMRGEHLE